MILVALGANLPSRFGTPAQTLGAAQNALDDHPNIRLVKSSATYLTAPVPVSDQPWYHNQVVEIETDLDPYALLGALQAIESEFGRVRSVRNAPRVIDLDLIAYHDDICDKPELIVPHPRAHERAFVLMPLRDLAPHWIHPLTGLSLDDMIAEIPSAQDIKCLDPEGADA